MVNGPLYNPNGKRISKYVGTYENGQFHHPVYSEYTFKIGVSIQYHVTILIKSFKNETFCCQTTQGPITHVSQYTFQHAKNKRGLL